MSSVLRKRAGVGSIINILTGMVQVLIRLVATFVLARILLPEDFGIIAYASLVYSLFSHLSEFGASMVIVTREQISQRELSTAFWFNLFWFAFLGMLTAISAKILSDFFDVTPLASLLPLYALLFIPLGFASVSKALLNKEMQFKVLNAITLVGMVIETLIAIILVVYYGFDYWGVVIGILCSEVVMSLCYMLFARWRPSLSFDVSFLRYFLRFGFHLTGERVLNYIRHNVDYLIIGKLLGSRELGFYSFAYRIPNLVYTKLAIPASSVLLPYMIKKRQMGRLLLGESYIRMTKYITFITYPILFGIIFLAEPMVLLFWGTQWSMIVLPLQIISISPMIYILSVSIGTIFLVKERPELLFKIEFFKLSITVVSVSLLGYAYGIVGVAMGMSLSAILTFWLSLLIAFRLIKMRISLLLREIMPIIIASLLTGIGAFWVEYFLHALLPLLFAFILSILVGMLIYFLTFLLLFNQTYQEIIALIHSVRYKEQQ